MVRFILIAAFAGWMCLTSAFGLARNTNPRLFAPSTGPNTANNAASLLPD